jgi:NAD(P)H-dependent FMN reductase
MSKKLQVIIGSTRPGRAGKPIADWFVGEAERDGRFEIEVTDLLELGLPPLDEPHHPRLRNYVHEHTRTWSAIVDGSDAFVFVRPEYTHGFSASVKNAIDYLHDEWAYKPVGFVSYGGISAGMRATQMLKPVVSCLRMVPVTDQVAIANFGQYLSDGVFAPGDAAASAATVMLDDLERTMNAIGQLRSRVA